MTQGKDSRERVIFDPILGQLEAFVANNRGDIRVQDEEIRAELLAVIETQLHEVSSRSGQFSLIHEAVAKAEHFFAETASGIPKETLMSLARRAPSVFLDGSDLLLASLIVKHATPDALASWSFTADRVRGLGVFFTVGQLKQIFRLIAVAKAMNNLINMARWLGKGGKLEVREKGGVSVSLPDHVRQAVENYERRRPRSRMLAAGGFFAPEADPQQWSPFRVPVLLSLGGQMIEAPAGSQRWLAFERYPTATDGGGLAKLLRGYDEALLETFSVGADAIIHFLTAFSVLILHSSPTLDSREGALQLQAADTAAQTEHMVGFAFGLGRKGFLRFSRAEMIQQIGRVRTDIASDQNTSEVLAAKFIDAFTMRSNTAGGMDVVAARAIPFLHASTEEYIYIDVLLVWDFLAGLLERGKEWYASQHGDQFVLQLKRWLDAEAPGQVVSSRRAVRLPSGASSDIDLLVRRGDVLWAVECKAYGKSRAFMIGEPAAITERRGRIRRAVSQAQRTTEAFARQVASGETEFDKHLAVEWLVCSPTTEFLSPYDEHGLIDDVTPRVVTPEELLELLLARRSDAA